MYVFPGHIPPLKPVVNFQALEDGPGEGGTNAVL